MKQVKKSNKRKTNKNSKIVPRNNKKQENNLLATIISSIVVVFGLVLFAKACSATNPKDEFSQTERTLTVTESVSKQVTETATTTEPPTESPTLPPTETPTPVSTEPPAPVAAEQNNLVEYWINTDSGKFHYSNCQTIKNEDDPHWDKRWCDRQELIAEGYSPCGICEP